jgi:putative DNA primase/helicase
MAIIDTVSTNSVHAATKFLQALFDSVEPDWLNVFLTALYNEKTENSPSPYSLTVTELDDERIGRFVEQHDKADWGTFFCVGVLKPGATKRKKENISASVCLHADIDLKDTDLTEEQVVKLVLEQRIRPILIVRSGHGLHTYYLFHEPLELTTSNKARTEAALKRLAHIVGGDPAVCEVARLMRLPGSHNTKNGDWLAVQIIHRSDERHDLDELCRVAR